MKRPAWATLVAWVLGVSLGVAAASCSGDGDDTVVPTTGTGATGAGGGGQGGHGTGGDLFAGNGPFEPAVAIEISPADPVLEVVNGVVPDPTEFTAVGITEAGDEVPVEGMWTFDRYDLGAIGDISGSLTVTGMMGGVGTVTFTSDDLVGTTSATVVIRMSDDSAAIEQGIKDAFEGASAADPAMSLLYPYDLTVFPRGLAGPVLQWSGGGASDVYHVKASSPTFEFEWWGLAANARYAFPTALTLPTGPADVWRVLTDSTEGNISVSVQRYDGAQAYLPVSETWTIAAANLTGIVYYWRISDGAIVRIPMGATAPEEFLQGSDTRCMACHSVSAQGNRIVVAFDGSRSPWGTFDAESGALEYDSNLSSGFQAISPNGSHILWGHWNDAMQSSGSLYLSTYDSGAVLATLTPGGGYPSHPAWSPDGTKIAFGNRTELGGLYFAHASLWVTDVDVATPSFVNPHQIVANDNDRPTVTYPSFSPGSDWIAFMRGNYAYCESNAPASPMYGQAILGDIWLTNLDGSQLINLDNLNGHGYLSAPDDDLNYTPSFLPVTVGGYMWVVFSSERNYGNTIQYGSTTFLPRPKQLWVAAVDPSPQVGQDPSHPAFWLPGQELNTENMRGQWALAPCKQLGETCDAGYECCDGFCRVNEQGIAVCQDQPGPCSPSGDACDTTEDCCDPGAQCIGGFCSSGPPQ